MPQPNECFWRAAGGGLADFVVSSAITGYFAPAQCTQPAIVDGAGHYWRAESDDLSQHELFYGAYDAGTLTVARTDILQSSNANAKVNFSAAPRVRLVAGSQLIDIASGQITSPTASLVIPVPAHFGKFKFEFWNYSSDTLYGFLVAQFSTDGGATWITDYRRLLVSFYANIADYYGVEEDTSGALWAEYNSAFPIRPTSRVDFFPGNSSVRANSATETLAQDEIGMYQEYCFSITTNAEASARINAVKLTVNGGADILTMEYQMTGILI